MSQETNLNVAPYFDDFDANNNYYRVLFKPGYPVQARELTTLQSILQNQIEKFGQHFFKEGSKVIPGNIGYNRFYYAVQLENSYLGVPVEAYVDQLVGKKITGQTSGVNAFVDKVLYSADSENGNLTLYINYLNSNTQDNTTQTFSDGELLVCNEDLTSGLLGNSIITAGQPFATTITNNAAAVGSSFQISNGVYFVRGQFVNVNTETIILDQYTNSPNYRIGLFVNEEIVTSDIEESLNDNSQGYNNYSAPGADRLRITLSLFKKGLEDFNDKNFVELAVVREGVLRSKKTTEYNEVLNELARRTYEESGDYYVKPFDLTVKESLNDNLGNNGIFNSNQFTYGGSTPSEDLAIYQISPGKAFVRGFECETISPTFLDVPKPRDTKTLSQQAINYNTGPTFKLNRVYGSPSIGVGNTYVLSLRDTRVGSSQNIASGKEIGLARVYDFRLESGAYNASNKNLNQWNISLYDIQTITEIAINEPITLSVPTFIKGKNSGATAFIKDSVVAGTALTVYQKKGDFIRGESFIIDGIENGRVAIAITSYGVSDIKSVYGIVGSGSTFSADCILSNLYSVGVASITAGSGGISSITSSNQNFPGTLVKRDSILSYTNPGFDFPSFAKVVSVGSTIVTVSSITTVNGICNGNLPTTPLNVSDLKILATNLDSSTDNSLYTALPKRNVSNVDLNDASLTIRKSFNVNISGSQLTIPVVAGDNETFLPFDEERYSLISSDGQIQTLSADRFVYLSGSKELQIYNLDKSSDTNATLITTLRKLKPKAKIKRKNRVNSIIVDKSAVSYSGIGSTTLNDGLSYGNYPYGTRVQDNLISLNYSDIIDVHAVFESTDDSNPSAPTAILNSLTTSSSTTSDLLVGEKIIGQSSGAVAIYAEKVNDTEISYIYKNENTFREGETVLFEESRSQAVIESLDSTSFNISFNYSFVNGQEGTFYNYAHLKLKNDSKPATRKLKIYFSNGYYDSTDDGDITTVNSYTSFNYAKEITSVNGNRLSDIIDIRPKTSPYTVSEGSRSPLEFYGRIFNSSGNSAANVLASDEDIIVSFSYYLARIDRVYLSKDGKMQVKYGTPSEHPEKPVSVDDSLEVATITLPPYLYTTKQASIKFLDHKRYRMVDIEKLEKRIKNLEYYTSLSLLETNTSNLFVPDADGLNRFKSGFFVDNFTSLQPQESSILYKNSLDVRNKELKPAHYTTSIDLSPGPVVGIDPNEDRSFSPLEGINVRKNDDVITLDYAEVEWLNQPFATRTESVTPFLISFWQATMELTPSSDTWIDTTRLEPKIIETEGNYAETLSNAVRDLNVDPQTGFAPTIWNAWEDNWTGRDVTTATRINQTGWTNNITGSGRLTGGRMAWAPWIGRVPFGQQGVNTFQVVEETIQEVRDTGVSTRTGLQTIVTEQFDQTSVGDRVVSRNLVPFMRSRNVQFVAKKLKPLTQIYAFFDGIDVTKYCVPKLVEISMISGVFQVGERVIGRVQSTGLNPDLGQDKASISFRVAQSNHREGPYNAPTVTYPFNPYTSQILQTSYSSTSDIINIDTFSLSDQPQGEYSGWIEPNMILVGETSGAQATVTNQRLFSDIAANLVGSFYIPNPNSNIHPKFEAGNKVLTLVNSETNDQNNATTIAEESYSSSGTLETVQENIISVRNARVENKQQFEERAIFRTTGIQVTDTRVISTQTENVALQWYDPLAQSFLVNDETGVFLTRCDVYFSSKDDMDIPLTFQLRTMENGYPTQKVLPFSEIVLEPSQINTSADGSVATSISFKAPVYLEGGKEYAICLASLSTKYSVYISRVGENDILSQSFISNQPYLGSLFKSQNASTWEASQWEDLKFILYRADFIESGSVEFYNPPLTEGNGQVAKLLPNPLEMSSKKVRVSLASTLYDPDLTLGNTVLQQNTNASGNYVGAAGSATGTLGIINAGIGYTPSSGSLTINNVGLTTVTGSGKNATANITVSNGVAVAATITNGGTGYQIGDVVSIDSFGAIPSGRNIRLSITSIASTNQIILDNVQGDFSVGAAGTLQYVKNTGITTIMNYDIGGGLKPNNIETITDGLHIVVNHKNHGMYSSDNLVNLSGVQSDINPTKLTVAYTSDSTGALNVDDSTQFTTFESVGVGTTNPGYLLIGDEVIEYTSVTAGSIGGEIIRGPISKNYPAGTLVYKYELNGISLNRINKTHNLDNVTVSNGINFDSYTIKIDNSSDGIDRSTGTGYPVLYAKETKSVGGYNVRSSQNIPYEIITPLVHNVTVKGTNITASLRTITGVSMSGNEVPFVDNGTQSVAINQANYLDTPRIIASRVNELNRLGDLPGNRSMNMSLQLDTIDSRISPVIDNQRVSAVFTSNRVNSIITNYKEDNRVNSITEDPTAFQYLSKEINLESGATSIKLLVNAHMNKYTDIRAFYAISENSNFDPIFTPFPGWNNLDDRKQVINPEDSEGLSDVYIPVSQNLGFAGENVNFVEYSFTADQLPSFRSYRIKLIMTSTNQVYVPRIGELRVIALA